MRPWLLLFLFVLLILALIVVVGLQAKPYVSIQIHPPQARVNPSPIINDAPPTGASPSPTRKPIKKPTPKPYVPPPTKMKVTPVTPRTCLHYSLDISDYASTKCYTEADYNQLDSLVNQLELAQAVRQVYLDAAVANQAEYARTSDPLYLDAANADQARAAVEAAKVPDLLTQIQTIAAHGW